MFPVSIKSPVEEMEKRPPGTEETNTNFPLGVNVELNAPTPTGLWVIPNGVKVPSFPILYLSISFASMFLSTSLIAQPKPWVVPANFK